MPFAIDAYLRRMYLFIRTILFWFDPERVHHFSMSILKLICKFPFISKWLRLYFHITRSELMRNVFGLDFRNPIGLGAGFDKNAQYLNELEILGFGFVEIGTVTPLPQKGNEKPRLFRLPEDKALINRMGFNNEGAVRIAKRLKKWKNRKQSNLRMIIGGNIGKNKNTPNEEAWKDYEKCFLELYDVVDYFVVNVSSPNTPGLRELQERDALKKILIHLQTLKRQRQINKPLLLKIAPDLTTDQINDIVDISLEINLDGLVISNTTISRENLTHKSKIKCDKIGAGGLSGKPLKEKSTKLIQYVNERTKGKIPIIASGGIFVAEDAKEKLNESSLVQVWTGFIYEGPSIVKSICKEL